MTIEKRKIEEDPIILLPEHGEEEEDLSWMIQNSDQDETKQIKPKGKK